MIRFLFIAVCLLIAAAAPGGQPGWTTVEVPLTTPAQATLLQRGGYDIWETRDGKALIYASPADLDQLERDGFSPVAVDSPALRASAKSVDGYPTFNEYVAQMNQWVADYPGLVSLTSIGQSVEGRELWMLKISDNVATDEIDEPEFLFIGLQHAREWLAGTTLQGLIQYVLDHKDTDPRAAAAINNFQIYVLLVSNPDGYVYTQTTDRLWRKNRRNNGNGTYGVDINRNFPFRWNNGTTSTSSFDYRGTAPLSEPEAAALNTWVLSRNGRVKGFLNYHTYGNHVMHSWAYTTAVAPGVEIMDPLVNDMAAAMHAVHGQTFDPGSWGVALGYTGQGVTDDEFHAVYGIPSITTEVRPYTDEEGGFVVPATYIQPTIDEQLEGMFVMLNWIYVRATDPTAPMISNLAYTRLSTTSVRVHWTTDDACDREADYGVTLSDFGTHVQP
ncbi:MAG: M14 family metallopeptidase, partial [Candidatus Sumerlaeota bacterium]